MHAVTRPTLREAVARLAPGTGLRDGLERILRGRTGALIVLGHDENVEAICDGGFSLDVRYAATRLRELCKMDGAVVLSTDGSRIVRANVQLVPDPSIPTDESGTRHRSAERAAIQTGYPVISVSHSMNIVTVYVRGERHVLTDSATILSRANQAIATLERYKTRLDEVSRQLSRAEIEDFVTLRDVMTVVQRLELVRRIGLVIDYDVVELGTDGRQLRLQLDELLGGNDTARELIVRDYHANPEPPSKGANQCHPGRTGRPVGRRPPRFHRAGKGFRISDDHGSAGFDAEPAWLPRDGRYPPAPVRPCRPAGPGVRNVAGSAGGQRRRSAISGRHRRHVGPSCARGVVTAGGIDHQRSIIIRLARETPAEAPALDPERVPARAAAAADSG